MTCSKGDAQLYKLMITYDDEVHGLGFLGLPSKPLQLTKCFCRNRPRAEMLLLLDSRGSPLFSVSCGREHIHTLQLSL